MVSASALSGLSTRLMKLLKPRTLQHTVGPSSSVAVAVQCMQKHKIGSLVVVGEEDDIQGIITERDYLLKMPGKCNDTTLVSSIMTKDVITMPAHSSIADCMNAMVNGDFRHLPVTVSYNNNKTEFVGIVSMRDVVKELVSQNDEEKEYLKSQLHKLANAVGSGGA